MAVPVSPPPLIHGATPLDHWRATRGARRLNDTIEQSMSEIERSLSPVHQRGLAIVEPSPRARQVRIDCCNAASATERALVDAAAVAAVDAVGAAVGVSLDCVI